MTDTLTRAAPVRGRRASPLGAALRRWGVARRTRAELAVLPDRGLADLGLARADIDRVALEAAARV